MRGTYKVVAHLIALGVVLQASFIALGWFGTINEVDDGLVFDKAYLESDDGGNIGHILHWLVGMNVMPLLGLILFVVAFFAKIPGGVKWAGFTFLAIIVQVTLAFVAFGVPAVGALHGINAFVVLGLGLYTGRRIAAQATTDKVQKTGAPAPV